MAASCCYNVFSMTARIVFSQWWFCRTRSLWQMAPRVVSARSLPLRVNLPRLLSSTVARFRATSALITNQGKSLTVQSEEGEVKYHPTWLRHNCQCPSCLSDTSQKTMDLSELTPSLTLESAHISDDSLELVWSNSHKGFIKLDCLRQIRNMARESQEESSPLTASELPVMSASGLLEDKEKQWMWLHTLNEYGVCLLTDYGTKKGSVKELALWTLYAIQSTFYGEVWTVETNNDNVSFGYTTQRVDLHMDVNFYRSPRGISLMHCVQFDDCVEGGESVMLDMFPVVEELRDKWPEHFDTLTRVPATFQVTQYNRDYPVDMVLQTPLIKVDSRGRIVEMKWGPWHEGPLMIPEEDIEPYYAAYHCLGDMLTNSKLKLYHRLRPGEVMTFNNRRVLHGRNEFTLNGGQRYFQGTYAEICHFKSAYRVLCKLLNKVDVPVRNVFSS